jgi:5-methylcytosine-specific restriction endonuclease McrA
MAINNDPVLRREYERRRREDHKNHAYDSIVSGKISDRRKWNMWCRVIKQHAKGNEHPYSEDFTNDIMFDMMTHGCFYCGDIATTIDRLDSKLDHTLDNCVGSCQGCNISKGVADPGTYIRKAYYRVHGKYYDNNTNIWFINKTKPEMSQYRKKIKKGVPFEMTKEVFDILIKSDCKYCHRKPTLWFGIDREVPSVGYIIGNIVTCCWDCNRDKHEDDNDTMYARNKRIADRVDSGQLVVDDYEQVILHNGASKTSKKVCVRGNVYMNMTDASIAIGENWWYVGNVIKSTKHVDDIFEITDEFYDEYKDSELHITKNMFVAFNHFYTNE